jgi:carbonic anhydrase
MINMPKFNVLYLVEKTDDTKTDNRIIILYDVNDEHYYYYGTRNAENNTDTYAQYSGKYNDFSLQTLVKFLKYTNDLFRNRIDIELHFVDIYEDEYDELTFLKLYEKINNFNEIFAYDNSLENEESITEKLEILKSN